MESLAICSRIDFPHGSSPKSTVLDVEFASRSEGLEGVCDQVNLSGVRGLIYIRNTVG